MHVSQEAANIKQTLADAELAQAHARLMNVQAAELERKHDRTRHLSEAK